MSFRGLISMFLFLCSAAPLVAQSGVVINKKSLDQNTLDSLQKRIGRVAPGRYWYDTRCGAWGYEGGPTVGYILPGLRVGGALRRDASGGVDGVFVNGRSLHRSEVIALQQLFGVVYQGNYWMDANGNYGVVGGAYLGNLVAQASKATYSGGGNGGGNSFWRSNTTDNSVSSNSSGDFYIMGDGFSYSNF